MATRLRRLPPVLCLALLGCGLLGDGTPDEEPATGTDSAEVVGAAPAAPSDTDAGAQSDPLTEAGAAPAEGTLPAAGPPAGGAAAEPEGGSEDAAAGGQAAPGQQPQPTDTLAFLLTRLDSLLAGQQALDRRLDSLTASEAAADTAQGLASTEVLGEAGRSVQSFGIAAFLAVVVIVVFNLVIRGAVWLLDALAERNARRRLFYKRLVPIVRIVLWIFATYLIVSVIFQIDAQGIFAAAAAIGVAVGFAAQDLLKNLFGGLIVVFDQPFQVGDKITVGETYGEVVSIGLRSTRIVTADDNLVTVPNAQVVDQQVANANAGELNCQVVTDLFLPGWADEETAKRIAFQAAASSKYVYLNKPIVVLVSDVFKETFLTRVRVKAYVLDPRFEFLFESDVTERARAGFRDAGLLRIDHMRTYLVEQAMARASSNDVPAADEAANNAAGQSAGPHGPVGDPPAGGPDEGSP